MNFNYYTHCDIAFGRGSASEIPGMIKKHKMNNVMVVYDKGVKAAGIADRVLEKVKEAGVNITIYDKVLPNPTNDQVEEAADIAKKAKINGFVAVGGGSSLDLTKAVNILMTNPGPIERYSGIGKLEYPGYPLIAVPTTAGTSSEITNVAALIDSKAVCKYVIIDNKITATGVIADPEFTKTMPATVTAATGMDAITHAVESYLSNMASPLTEYNSLKALQIFYENLPKAVKDGSDMKAREQMMLGCIIVGFAFANANLGLVHAIAHTLSAHFGLAHGTANATVLPYVIEFNAVACPEKMTELARTINLPLSGNLNKDKYLFGEKMKKLCKEIGIPTLSEQGIKIEDLDMLADDVLKEPVLNFNPRQNITKEQVMEILRKAF